LVEDLRRPFGRRVRALREKRGLSQEALAERADLHWTYISGVERGRRNPSLNVVGRIARALNVTPSELLSGIGAPSAPRRRRSGDATPTG
jgi:transcriptional regulator with XRE-family HTH domain